MLLLDTHAWIWIVAGDARRVRARARRVIARAAARDAIRVSTASVFEILALCTAGRLRLTRSPDEWIETSLEEGGVRLTELTRSMAIDAGRIPRGALADPLDRLLVATARELDAVLVTADAAILDFAASTTQVRVLDMAE